VAEPVRWRELTVPLPAGADSALVEALFQLCDEAGAPGAAAEDEAVVTYFPDDQRAASVADHLRASLAALAERVDCGPLALRESTIEETDWAEAWKQYFRPRRVGRRIITCPSWEEAPAQPGDVVITLDPGQAFGTGDHATTRMTLELLERRLAPGQTVYDIGTGSGILAIAALKLGASHVVATDLDPVCARAARENLCRNGVADRASLVLADGLDCLRRPADLILTNIVSAMLVRLAPAAARLLRPGGTWLASGMIRDNERDVARAIDSAGMRLVERLEEDEWVAVAASR
jgi:ribosomal protein L11 methyltransferase